MPYGRPKLIRRGSVKGPVTWHEHGASGKWHAFQPAEKRSVCDWASRKRVSDPAERPADAETCLVCLKALGLPVPAPKQGPPLEAFRARWEGGPYDGEVVELLVLRYSETRFVVLEGEYDRARLAAATAARVAALEKTS